MNSEKLLKTTVSECTAAMRKDEGYRGFLCGDIQIKSLTRKVLIISARQWQTTICTYDNSTGNKGAGSKLPCLQSGPITYNLIRVFSPFPQKMYKTSDLKDLIGAVVLVSLK